jgi:HEAT repeat protein
MTDAGMEYPASLLTDLASPVPSTRLKASKQLEKELRNAATRKRKAQFGSERATTPLIAALDDPDPNVVHNAVIALTQISRHYHKDDRAYARLLPLVHSTHPLTARWAIDALIQLGGERSLDDVLPLCDNPSQEVRAMTLSHLYAWLVVRRQAASDPVSLESRERLRAAALRALGDDDRSVRGNAASLLKEVGSAADLPALRKALEEETYWLTEQTLVRTIESIEGGA